MKKLSFLLTFCLFGLFVFAQPYNWSSANAGNWSSQATWNNIDGAAYDYPSTTNDIVIIENAYPVTLDVDDLTVQSVTITNSTDPTQLIITNSFTLTTTGDFHIAPGSIPNNSQLVFQGTGTINIGGNFIIEANLATTSTTIFNIKGYYKHLSGLIAFSGNITLNISTDGPISDVNEHNFYIAQGDIGEGTGARYDFGDDIVFNINLQDGHSDANGVEIYLEKAGIDGGTNGHMVTTINNNAGDDLYIVETDLGLGEVDINMGAGNVHRFKNISTDITPNYWILNVNSGKFEMENGARLTILGQISGEMF